MQQFKGNREALPVVPPSLGFNGELRPYQVKGVSWLTFLKRWGLGACLADDMGLGKTIQFIALLLKALDSGSSKPSLLICPTSLVGNWIREVKRFAPSVKSLVHHGSERLTGEDLVLEASRCHLVVSTYSLINRDADVLSAIDWDMVVLDEAQNIKNHWTKQAQAVKRLKTDYRVALTGTPIENRLSELWSIMDFLNPGYLGILEGFSENFAIPIERYRDVGKQQRLQRLVQPLILRRLKTDPNIIRDLPEKMEMKVYCNLTEEQASIYEAFVNDTLMEIESSEGIRRRGLIFRTLTRLKQICDHPALFTADSSKLEGRSGKMERLKEMLDEVVESGDKALVFTQYAKMGEMLKKYIQSNLGCEVLFLHGGVPRKKRDEMVSRFQGYADRAPVFVLSLKAGGLGLNLTRANNVFHYDRWWNPAVENQATDRVFRIGQTKNVQVHKLISVGTLEEKIDEMIESKKELAENILGTGEGWLTELGTEELRSIFTLRHETMRIQEGPRE
jgi:SNF2 family DNA or RNA helicase